MTNQEDLLTPAEVASRLRVSPSTIRRWIRIGALPALKIKGTARVRWSDVLKVAKREES